MYTHGKAQAWIGASVRRKEDARLLVGAGRYVDDLDLPGTLHLALVRSPHAHARIERVDGEPALARPGVVAVADGRTVLDRLGPMPTAERKEAERRRLATLAPNLVPVLRAEVQPLVASDKARYVGEPVAVVLADSRYAAEDAAETVAVGYAPLAPVTDAASACRPDAALVHDELGDNLALRVRVRTGDVDAAFARADRVVERRYRMQRVTGIPVETRGVLARPEPDGGVTLWVSNQTVHAVRDAVAHHLRLAPERVRVIAPDVGGGFGIKSGVHAELVLAAWLAREYGRPVKWIEDRFEHLRCAAQTRDQVHEIALALRADGTILGLRDRFTVDAGAYNSHGLTLPHNTANHLIGPYRVPALDVEGAAYYTNKVGMAPYRGAGRPEAVFAMDRVLDEAAREVGLDPADLRRRNLVTAAEMPYATGLLARDGQPHVYDSGDYAACFEAALELVDYAGVRREQPTLWARGVYRGVGTSAYVESTGNGPYEGASVGLDAAGHVWVYTGACSQGQGHATTFAQVCADQLGLDLEQVTVVTGDTAGVARGQGTRASRSAVTAGSAIAQASGELGERLRVLAASLLEADAGDLELAQGAVSVRGVPERAVPFARLAALAGGTATGGSGAATAGDSTATGRDGVTPSDGGAPPPDHPHLGLRVTRYFEPPTFTYANAAHAAVVDVDAETGVVRLLRYGVAHDCGRVINPIVADGQIHGGVAQGIGNALLEEVVYDEAGQLLVGSLMDYLVPTSCDVPAIGLSHSESLSPHNPLGVKGLGEGGAISPPAAIGNAVADALRPLGVTVDALPLTPDRVLALIAAARA